MLQAKRRDIPGCYCIHGNLPTKLRDFIPEGALSRNRMYLSYAKKKKQRALTQACHNVRRTKYDRPKIWFLSSEDMVLIARRYGSYRPKIWFLSPEDMAVFWASSSNLTVKNLRNGIFQTVIRPAFKS